MWKIVGHNITQKFNHRTIFKDVSFSVESGHSLVITGPNGSGKTTLIRTLCHLLRPKKGEVRFTKDGTLVHPHHIYPYLGLVGPYLQLYNDLTAFENYRFFARIRGLPVDVNHFKLLMEQVGLKGRELDELKTYSSGMLQRAKYVMALLHQPPILILDEPTSNLDEAGVAMVYELIEAQRRNNILIMATNEPSEIKFGDQRLDLAS